MRHWRWGWVLVFGAVLVVAVGLALEFRRSPTEKPSGAWDDGVRLAVWVIDEDRTYDAELTEYPVVSGRVAYEGPTLTEGEENWKAAHVYRGVDLRAVIDWAVGLDGIETLTLVALDGWHKTLPRGVLEGRTPAGTAILALSVDGESPDEWDDAPMLVFLPEDERFSNQDMLDALGPEGAHYFGERPSSAGLMVKGVVFLVVDYDGGRLPMLSDL